MWRLLLPMLIVVGFTCGATFAAQPPILGAAPDVRSPPPATPAVFWVTWVIVTGFLVVLLQLIRRGLSNSAWSLADAVSEEAGNQGVLPAGQKPIMVASSSRLIALLGLLVLLALYLGVGHYLLWALFSDRQLPNMSDVAYFFLSGLALFAPYAFNQAREAFTALGINTSPAPTPPTAPLTIAADVPPGGTVNTSYTTTLRATGGTPPYTWTRISGNLPPGFNLSPHGVISGTPTSADASAFTVQVQDQSAPAQTAQKTFTITIQ